MQICPVIMVLLSYSNISMQIPKVFATTNTLSVIRQMLVTSSLPSVNHLILFLRKIFWQSEASLEYKG
jgi:hypothetical protein